QGFAPAQASLAVLLIKGRDIAHDVAQGVQWYEKAAAQDFPNAAYHLGELYERGGAVPRDPATAMHWYRVAAGLGEPWPMMALARLTADPTAALDWLSRASQ